MRSRSYRFQRIGKLAAVRIPSAELIRLDRESKGNIESVLAPMRKALKREGFDDVFIVPAQTTIVELREAGSVEKREGEVAKELVDLVTLSSKLLTALEGGAPNKHLAMLAYKLKRTLAAIVVHKLVGDDADG
jgi:hypothetical protein